MKTLYCVKCERNITFEANVILEGTDPCCRICWHRIKKYREKQYRDFLGDLTTVATYGVG